MPYLERIIYFYRLKEGVTIEDFRKWSIEKDLPITSAQPGVQRFETFQVTSSGEGESRYDVMEYIETHRVEVEAALANFAPPLSEEIIAMREE